MQTKKVNDIEVHPFKGDDKRPYKYEKLLPMPYGNVFIVGGTGTGKSLLASLLIRECISNRTVMRLFSTTMEADKTTSKTLDKLKKRGIDVEAYEDLEPGQLADQLAKIKDFVENEDNKKKLDGFKNRFPLVIYFWDDFREKFAKHPEIGNLFTKSRHYKAINIVSTLRYKDLPTCARCNNNLHVMILCKDIPEKVLKDIHIETYMNIPFEKFMSIYDFATQDKFNFLFVDVHNRKFRKNFDEEIIL